MEMETLRTTHNEIRISQREIRMGREHGEATDLLHVECTTGMAVSRHALTRTDALLLAELLTRHAKRIPGGGL